MKRAGAKGNHCLSVLGDRDHPTVLLKGKLGPVAVLGSTRTGASLTWLGQTVLPKQQSAPSLFCLGGRWVRSRGMEVLGGTLKKTDFLWQDSVEGTPVLPQDPCVVAQAGRSLGCWLFLLSAWHLARWGSPRCVWVLPRSVSSSQTLRGCETFPTEVCDCRSVGSGELSVFFRSIPASLRWGPLSCQAMANGGQSPLLLPAAVMGVGWVMGGTGAGSSGPGNLKHLAEVAGGGRI